MEGGLAAVVPKLNFGCAIVEDGCSAGFCAVFVVGAVALFDAGALNRLFGASLDVPGFAKENTGFVVVELMLLDTGSGLLAAPGSDLFWVPKANVGAAVAPWALPAIVDGNETLEVKGEGAGCAEAVDSFFSEGVEEPPNSEGRASWGVGCSFEG